MQLFATDYRCFILKFTKGKFSVNLKFDFKCIAIPVASLPAQPVKILCYYSFTGWIFVCTMNTVLSRANSLFAFSLSVMAALTFGCFITTAFKDRRVPVNIHVAKVML